MNFYGEIFHFSRQAYAVPHQSETWSELDGETKYFGSGEKEMTKFYSKLVNLSNLWAKNICFQKDDGKEGTNKARVNPLR